MEDSKFFAVGSNNIFNIKDTTSIELEKGKGYINVVCGGFSSRVDLPSVDAAKAEFERISTLLVTVK